MVDFTGIIRFMEILKEPSDNLTGVLHSPNYRSPCRAVLIFLVLLHGSSISVRTKCCEVSFWSPLMRVAIDKFTPLKNLTFKILRRESLL